MASSILIPISDPTRIVAIGMRHGQGFDDDAVIKTMDLWLYQNRAILQAAVFDVTEGGLRVDIRTSNRWIVSVVRFGHKTKGGSKYDSIDYSEFEREIDFPHCSTDADTYQLMRLGDSLKQILLSRNICFSIQLKSYVFRGDDLLMMSVMIASRNASETYRLTVMRFHPHHSRTYKEKGYAAYRYLTEQRNQESELFQYDSD